MIKTKLGPPTVVVYGFKIILLAVIQRSSAKTLFGRGRNGLFQRALAKTSPKRGNETRKVLKNGSRRREKKEEQVGSLLYCLNIIRISPSWHFAFCMLLHARSFPAAGALPGIPFPCLKDKGWPLLVKR